MLAGERVAGTHDADRSAVLQLAGVSYSVASGNREWALTVGTFRQRDAILEVEEVVTSRPSTRVRAGKSLIRCAR